MIAVSLHTGACVSLYENSFGAAAAHHTVYLHPRFYTRVQQVWIQGHAIRPKKNEW